MSFVKRLVPVGLVVLMVALFAVGGPAQAESEDETYFQRFANASAECFAGGPSYTVTYDVEFSLDVAVNQVRGITEIPEANYFVSAFQTVNDGTGTNTVVFGPFSSAGAPFPFTLIQTFETFAGGELVYRSVMTTVCSGVGPATPSIVNEDLNPTASGEEGEEAAPPDDGREDSATAPPTAAIYADNIGGELSFAVWDVTDGTGPAFSVSNAEIEAVAASPESNTEIKSSADGYYRFFRLATGELQLNIGPDAEGKTFVTIFSADGRQVVRTYTIDADGTTL
jgi:hypothetical protein